MIKLLFLASIFLEVAFATAACSASTANVDDVAVISKSTIYNTSTQQLKSNRIPDSVFQMTNLRELSISGMDCDYVKRDKEGRIIIDCWMIKEIPADIKNLKKLTTLQLPLNAISRIPNEITQLTNLVSVNLTDNPGLSDVDILARLTQLKYLCLYGCNIKKFPADIGNLRNLKELGLAGNDIGKVELERIKKALPNCKVIF
ncbi:MAG: leucine-rich repeat domain-containing protein [Janthinobacterium lividum]